DQRARPRERAADDVAPVPCRARCAARIPLSRRRRPRPAAVAGRGRGRADLEAPVETLEAWKGEDDLGLGDPDELEHVDGSAELLGLRIHRELAVEVAPAGN